jgi:aminoglycoside phosphotransferase (APT) family kinase protein
MMYRMPAGMFTGLKGLDLAELGIPSEEEYVEAYCRRTGREGLPQLDYLFVFVIFRLAAICHGVRGRLARGSASSAHAQATAALTEPLADLALAQVR